MAERQSSKGHDLNMPNMTVSEFNRAVFKAKKKAEREVLAGMSKSQLEEERLLRLSRYSEEEKLRMIKLSSELINKGDRDFREWR